MIANKVKKTDNFTVVDNGYLRDENLSFKAKGILTYFLSLPGDWVIYYEEVITHSKDGIKSFRSGIDELIKEGYIRRFPVRENGVIVRWETEGNEAKLSQYSQKVEVVKEEVSSYEIDKDLLLSTNQASTDESKDLNNISDYDFWQNTWNGLDDLVFPIDDIWASPKYMICIDRLVDKYGTEDVLATMKSIKTNPYAHRYRVRFDWFITDRNFNKLYEDMNKH